MIELDTKRKPPMYRIMATFSRGLGITIKDRYNIFKGQSEVILNYYLCCRWFGHKQNKASHLETKYYTKGYTTYCLRCSVIIEGTRKRKDK